MDFVKRALGGAEPAPLQPAMAQITIISTEQPVKLPSESRSAPASD